MAHKREKSLLWFGAVLFSVIILYALFSVAAKPQQAFSRDDAAKFALEDAAKRYAGAEFEVESAAFDEPSGQWKIVLAVVRNGHSACPTVDQVEYSLMPISSRPAKPVISDCGIRLVFRREQALINSAKQSSISPLVASGASGCAFQFPISDDKAARAYCSFVDLQGIRAFASSNSIPSGAWVAQWTLSGESKLIAMDSAGKVLATG